MPPAEVRTVQLQKPNLFACFLQMRFGDTLLSTGTAFTVKGKIKNWLITNRHNFTGKHQDTGKHLSKTLAEPDNISVWLHSNDLNKRVDVSIKLYDTSGLARWFEHPKLGNAGDFVALEIPNFPEITLYPCRLETSIEMLVPPASSVSIIGYPFGKMVRLFPIWVNGFVASEPELDFEGKPIFVVDARTRPGSSGSPVIAFREGNVLTTEGIAMYSGPVNKFMGIYSGRIGNDSDLGIVWKASCIKELINHIDG